MIDLGRDREKAILVGLHTDRTDTRIWKLAFEELTGLVETAGARVVASLVQNRSEADPATYIGKGKLQELTALAEELEADIIVFDSELTPVHVRNLENCLPCKVLDRTQIILDIFAERAKTKEGKLQVELAQLSYLMPRLSGKGKAMSRLGGGIGTRGPGETKLEIDRRRIRGKIADLKTELREVRLHRSTQRQRRKKQQVPVIALVGYTNAGKSTILHALTERFGAGSQTTAEGQNRLFDTLDPTARKIGLPQGGTVIVTDTVGFIQQLPHHLIDSFRATLEETNEADVLLHIVDASHPAHDIQMDTVYQVLNELHVLDKPIITVFNKMDYLNGEFLPDDPKALYTVKMSALNGNGLPQLMQAIDSCINTKSQHMSVILPYDEGSLTSALHERCKVYQQRFLENGIYLDLDAVPELAKQLERFQVNPEILEKENKV
ncbi:GTPase HflX [Effusibacillus dendaii]|uniref:GTPase HflX n=1 Tax=Effusibacillus dendaii TaxID=2743772 RepID=A0A7I8DB21_9BACL|nr:GTPase HflX [Effusibacillus dendaii]BCJ85720.1 GTPase HflX [Effusibacillus dendaii]